MTALAPAISRTSVQRSKGILWGSLIVPVFLIGVFLQWSGLSGYGNGGPFQNPAGYIFDILALGPIFGFFLHASIHNGRLRKAPWKGSYLLGGSVVVAGVDALHVYLPQQIQKVEMRGVSTNLFIQTDGKWFAFPCRDLSHLRWAEQQVRMAMAQPQDPFAWVVAPPAAAKEDGMNFGWPIGLAMGIAIAIPMRFAIGKAADEKVFSQISYDYDYGVSYYMGRGGAHEDEVHKKWCDVQIQKAKTPPELKKLLKKPEQGEPDYYTYAYRDASLFCTDRAKEITGKIDGIYAAAKADLEKRIPDKAKPILMALLDASKNGAVGTKIIINGPDPDELDKMDAFVRKNGSRTVPVGKTFDKSALSRREGQVKEKFMAALNGLVKDNLLSAVDVDATPAAESYSYSYDKPKAKKPDLKPALTATIDYSLIPKFRGDDLIVYSWVDNSDPLGVRDKAGSELYLGLTIQFHITMKFGDIEYPVTFDAPAAANFSVDTTYGLASSASVYTRMVDTALDNTQENMSKRVFEKAVPGAEDEDAPPVVKPKKAREK